MKVTQHIEQLLRQGRKPRELIDLGFAKSAVTRVYRRLKREKAAIEAKTPEGTKQTECHPESAVELTEKIVAIQQRLDSVEKELQRLGNLMNGLPEMIVLVTAAQEFGPYMHDICPHHKDSVCTLWTWPSEGDIPQGIGEALAPDD
jgi:predicted nuclease with TOPRIM domain